MKNIKNNLIYFSPCIILGIWACVFIPLIKYLNTIEFMNTLNSTVVMIDGHRTSDQMIKYSFVALFISIVLDIFIKYKLVKTNKIQVSTLKKGIKIAIQILEIITILILWKITQCL